AGQLHGDRRSRVPRDLRRRSFSAESLVGAHMAVTKDIVPRVHRLGNSVVNWYLVEGDGGLTAIDTGLPGFDKTLNSDLATLGFELSDVKAVILTHSDGDHTGLAGTFKDAGAD